MPSLIQRGYLGHLRCRVRGRPHHQFGTIDRGANIRPQGAGLVFWADSFVRFDNSRLGKDSVNAAVFIEFLKRQIKGAGREIFLIVDRGSAHRAKKVSAFLLTLGRKLRLFFPPPYAPDRDPGALVWKHLEAAGRMAVTGRGKFREEGSPLDA